MHAVHHSEAVILKSLPSGEANRRVWLFTETFGLVVATVQGVRKQGAKLQMNLTEYSWISADLVKGKDVWRLVSASIIDEPLRGNLESDLARSYVRTLGAVERFCQGEEVHPALFSHLKECANCLKEGSVDAAALDTVSVWKLMALLGYMDVSDEALFTLPLAEAASQLTQEKKEELIRETNAVIQTTHL